MSSRVLEPAPHWDVALSFAGEDRLVAETLATSIREAEFRVFYDVWEQDRLWGEDLYQYLHSVYRDMARFCVILISANYEKKAWTSHELKSAQERSFQENSAYILPLRLDDTDLPGMSSVTGYLDLRHMSVEKVANLLVSKLKAPERNVRRDFQRLDLDRQLTLITRAAVTRNSAYLDELMIILSESPSAQLRRRAAWALDNLCDPRALNALLLALSDPDWQVRSNSGWALVHMGKVIEEDVRRLADTTKSATAKEMADLVLERLR